MKQDRSSRAASGKQVGALKSSPLSKGAKATVQGQNSAGSSKVQMGRETLAKSIAANRSCQRKVLLVDVRSTSLRRIDDLISSGLYLLLIVIVILGAIYAHTTADAVASDLTNVFVNTQLAQLLLLPLSVLQNLFTFLAPVALLGLLAWQGRWWAILQSALVGILGGHLALLVSELMSYLPEVFRASLTVWGVGEQIVAISTPLSAMSAMITFAGERKQEKLIRWLWSFAWLVLALAVLQGRMTLPSAVVTVLLGICLGTFARFVFGVPNSRPSHERFISALESVNIIPKRIIRLDFEQSSDPLITQQLTYHSDNLSNPNSVTVTDLKQVDPVAIQLDYCAYELENETFDSVATSRYYLVWDQEENRYLINASDADIHKLAWLKDTWNNIRLRTSRKSTMTTVRQTGEYTALMSAMTSKAGLNTRIYYGAAQAGSSILNIFRNEVDLRPLNKVDLVDLNPIIMERAWAQLLQAHQHGLAHRNLTASNLCITPDAQVYLVDWEQGEIATSELTKLVDRIQLLVLSATIFGVRSAVSAARKSLGVDNLKALVPVLQGLALPTETRNQAKAQKLLPALRLELLEKQDPDQASLDPDLAQADLRRFSIKTVLVTVVGVAALIVVLGSLNFTELSSTISKAQPLWIIGGICFSLAISYGQAISLRAVCPNHLGKWECFLVQIAGAVTALVAPSGVGSAALNFRYLIRKRMPTALTVATVSLLQGFQFIVTVSLLIVMLAFTGTSMNVRLPSSTLLTTVAVIVVALAICVAVPKLRIRIWKLIAPTVNQIWPRLVWIMTSPKRITLTCLGVLFQTITQVLCFQCSLAAFGGAMPFSALTVTFLVSNTLGSVIPTPGGLGTVEAALTAGLKVAGIPGSVALSTVLLYRLLTFWFRAPLGWLALKYLQKTDIV